MGCNNAKPAKPNEAKKEVETIPVEVKNQMAVHGLYISCNAMGPILLAEAYKCGSMVSTAPGTGTMTDEFLKLNPFHAIPTVSDGDFSIAESNTILRYMARTSQVSLYPETSTTRCAFIDWAMDRFSSSMMGDVGKTIAPILGFAEAPEDQKAAGEEASKNIEEFAKVFLKEKFIGGDKLSIADYKVAPFFFAYSLPEVQAKACVTISDRIKEFNADFAAACASSKKLIEAGGGSIKEILDKDGQVAAPNAEKIAVKEDLLKNLKLGGKQKVEIHGVPISMNCAGALCLAAEAEIGHQAKDAPRAMVFCMPGVDTMKEGFLAMNPFHGIPTLKDGEFCCAESNAILRYLAQTYAPQYYPTDAKKRATIDWALDRFGSSLYADAAKTLYACYGFVQDPGEEEMTKLWKAGNENLESFAKHFLKGKFIGGDSLSIADFKVAPFFYGYEHPFAKVKGNQVPQRIIDFNKDFAAACKHKTIFDPIKDFLNGKQKEYDDSKVVVVTEDESKMNDAFKQQADMADTARQAEETTVLESKAEEVPAGTGGSSFGCWCN